MISLKKFKEYKNVLENTITNRAFRSRLLFEAIEDETFSKDVLGLLVKLEGNVTSQELDSVLEEIRKKTDYYYQLSINSILFEDKIGNVLSEYLSKNQNITNKLIVMVENFIKTGGLL